MKATTQKLAGGGNGDRDHGLDQARPPRAPALRRRASKHMLLRTSPVLAISVVLLWGAVQPVFASPAAPFRGSFVVTQALTPDPTCGGFHIVAEGSGRATGLGRTEALFDECADFVEEPGRVHVYGNVVLTSANGDELHLAVDKAGNLPDATGDVHVAGPYTVTGGTGRFAGATGHGTTTTDTNVTSVVATVNMVGTLVVDRRAG